VLFPPIQLLFFLPVSFFFSDEIKYSCIAADGKLTPAFEYISNLRKQQELAAKKAEASTTSKYGVETQLLIEGHLFDSGFINMVRRS
jgi:hypothetical protein